MNLKVTLQLMAFLIMPLVTFSQVCDNATEGGKISADQTLCTPGDTPAPLTNVTLPSGGSGDLEYIWILTTEDPSEVTTVWTVIPGSTSPDYAPGAVFQTTYFRRCARRTGCDQYSAESNIVRICVDTEAPSVTNVPADFTIECDETPVFGQPDFSDDCDHDLDILIVDDFTGDNCLGYYTRTWKAVDDCGRTVEAIQTITAIDTQAPNLSLNSPYEAWSNGETIAYECNEDPVFNAADASATDNCDDDVSIELSSTTTTGDCPTDGFLSIIEYTWTATDDCDNATSFTIYIKIIDTTDPVFTSVPADATIECDQPVVFGTPEFTDNCDGDLTVDMSDDVQSDGCTTINTRTWVITDDCGNAATSAQTITQIDTTDPEFTYVPADVTIECDEPVIFGTPEFTDNCDDDLTVDMSDDVQSDGCTTVNTRTWTITDNCGNSASASQTITQVDTTDPEFTYVPADVTIECDEPVVFGTPEFTDNCDDDLTVTESDDISTDGCTTVYARTWTITDNCGNSADATQVITSTDTTDPEFIDVPADETIECDEIPVFGMPEFTDNCDDNLEVVITDDSQTNGCTTVNTRTWKIIDNCGNYATATQTITQVDTKAPVWNFACEIDATLPTSIGADCPADASLSLVIGQELTVFDSWQAGGIDIPNLNGCVADNCVAEADLIIRVTDISETFDGCQKVISVTFAADDGCGNIADGFTCDYTFIDDEAPEVSLKWPYGNFVNGDTLTFECTDAPILGSDSALAIDNCDDDLDIDFSEVVVGGDCPNDGFLVMMTCTWTAKDDCGNEGSFSITIKVVDTTAPEIVSVPDDMTIECDQPIVFGMPTATDNCDVNLDFTSQTDTLDNGCEVMYQRTWLAIDDCGNSATATQTITTIDTTNPVFVSVPADMTIECDQPVVFGTPGIEDNCDEDLAITEDNDISTDGCTTVYTKTWTVTDDCGNSATAIQVITSVDTTDPVFTSVPADETIECDQPVVFGTPEFTDNCDDDLEVAMSDDVQSDGCTTVNTRTWTITDNCGNSAMASQTITQVDTTDPVFTYVPADETIECDESPVFGTPEFEDNCDDDLDFSMATDTNVVDLCTTIYTRTWTIVDNCGNTTVAAQVITAIDTKAPEVSLKWPYANFQNGDTLAFECTDVPILNLSSLLAVDNCDDSPSVTFDEEVVFGDCDEDGFIQMMRCSWTAEDNCDNVSTFTIYVQVVDTNAPSFTSLPNLFVLDCESELEIDGSATATDICDVDVEVSFTIDTLIGDDDIKYQVNWTASDDCGNSVDTFQIVTVPCSVNFMFINTGVSTDNGQVQLSWTTMNDRNEGKYYIQRSKSGAHSFEFLGDPVSAEGKNFIELDYESRDAVPMQGHSFYRIQYVDLRGEIHVSDIMQVTFDAPYRTLVYPNPVHETVNIELLEAFEKDVIVNLQSRDGRILQQMTVAPGTSVVNMDIQNLTDGMYFITVQGVRGKSYATRIIKSDN